MPNIATVITVEDDEGSPQVFKDAFVHELEISYVPYIAIYDAIGNELKKFPISRGLKYTVDFNFHQTEKTIDL